MIKWIKEWWWGRRGYYDDRDLTNIKMKFAAAKPGEAIPLTQQEQNAVLATDPHDWQPTPFVYPDEHYRP